MRFTLVSLALLALAHSVAPGVHGAPAVASDHMNSLVVRQVPGSIITGLLASLSNIIENILGGGAPSPQAILQELQSSLAGATGLLPRALPSSSEATFPTFTASLSTYTSTTTTIVPLPAATVSNASSGSLSSLQASLSTPPQTRMRRQSPSSHPVSAPSIVGSQSAPQPLQPVKSVLASVLSVASSKVETPKSVASQPTSSIPSSSTSQA